MYLFTGSLSALPDSVEHFHGAGRGKDVVFLGKARMVFYLAQQGSFFFSQGRASMSLLQIII